MSEAQPLDVAARDLVQARSLALRQAVARLSGGLVLGLVFGVVGVVELHGGGSYLFTLGIYFGVALLGMGLLEAYLPRPPLGISREVLVWAGVWAVAAILTLGAYLQAEFTEAVHGVGGSPEEALRDTLRKLGRTLEPRRGTMFFVVGLPLALQTVAARRGWPFFVMPLIAPILAVQGFAVIQLLFFGGSASNWGALWVIFFSFSCALVAARAFGDWVERRWTRWRTASG